MHDRRAGRDAGADDLEADVGDVRGVARLRDRVVADDAAVSRRVVARRCVEVEVAAPEAEGPRGCTVPGRPRRGPAEHLPRRAEGREPAPTGLEIARGRGLDP